MLCVREMRKPLNTQQMQRGEFSQSSHFLSLSRARAPALNKKSIYIKLRMRNDVVHDYTTPQHGVGGNDDDDGGI